MEHGPQLSPHKDDAPIRRMDWFNKLRLLWIPYLMATLCITVVLSLLHIFPILRLHWLHVGPEVPQFWLPLIASAILSMGFLLPRIRRASMGREQMKFIFLNVLSVVILWVPLTQSQRAVSDLFSEVKGLPSPSLQGSLPYADRYAFDSKKALVEARQYVPIRMRGKANDEVVLVVLTPLKGAEDTSQRTTSDVVSYREFTLTFRSGLDSAQVEKVFRPWLDSLLTADASFDESGAHYFSRITDSRKRAMAEQAMQLSNMEGSLALEPSMEPLKVNPAAGLQAWGITYGASLAIWLAVVALLRLKAEPEARTQTSPQGILLGLRAIFLPRKGYRVTPIVILLNLLFYLVCAVASGNPIQFDGNVLIALGGNKPSLTQGQGEYWRLLTSAFLHGGLMHLMANMYGMFMMGRMLEPLLRAPRFLASYLAAALVGSIASVLFLSGDAVRIGASGALFGLMGMLLALALTPLFPQQIRQTILRTMFTTLGINILTSFLPNIDYTAHIGGLVCGLMLGFLWYPTLGKEKKAMIEKARHSRP